jgi:hypothetical protein
MFRCCQYRAFEGRDHHEPCASIRGLAEEASVMVVVRRAA